MAVKSNFTDDAEIQSLTRRVLFKRAPVSGVLPGAGTSAAKEPERHLKVKVTINIDSDLVQHFKEVAEQNGRPYQSLINQVLREYVSGTKPEQVAKDVKNILSGDEKFLSDLAARIARLETNGHSGR